MSFLLRNLCILHRQCAFTVEHVVCYHYHYHRKRHESFLVAKVSCWGWVVGKEVVTLPNGLLFIDVRVAYFSSVS